MYKLVAFDAYGTLFDVYSMGQLAEEFFPGQGEVLSVMWRDRQIEYTRLVTMSDPSPQGSKYYLPFWEITIRALRYVCKRLKLELTEQKEAQLMAEYARLKAFGDASSVLEQLHQKGIATAILSNGSREMLRTVVQSNGLESYLDQVVTVEEVKLFKTAPQSYQLLIDAFSFKKEEILFVSSNAWDALGASWFGYDVFWVNRSNLPFEEIGPLPTYQGSSLSALLELLNGNNS